MLGNSDTKTQLLVFIDAFIKVSSLSFEFMQTNC